MSTSGEPVARSDVASFPLLRPDARFTDRLDLARAALDVLRTRFGAVVASLGIADYGSDQLQVLTDASVGDDQLPSFVAFPLTTRMMLTDALGSSDVRVLPADDYTATYPTVASVVRRPDVRSLVAVGFQRGGVTGSVSIGLTVEPDLRTAGDLQATAALIGDALARWDEANRRNREAAELHRSLAPGDRSDRRDLVRRTVHLAATPSDAIGGDWFDVFDLPDGRFVAIVGDVAGRGADAVVAMAQTSAALRALLVRDTSPHRAIEQLDGFCAVTHAATGTSCVVAVVDTDLGTIEVCHAGHPSAIVVADGAASLLTRTPGPLVGFPDGPRSSDVAALPPGATLVLYSNGLLRASMERDVDRPTGRLAEALARLPDAPPGMLVADMLEGWTAGDAPDDDLVVVAIRRLRPDRRVFSVTEDATPAAITVLRHDLAGWLDDHGCRAIAGDVELAVSELLANVVEHAYRSHRGGRMLVEARFVAPDATTPEGAGPAGELEVAVIDDGHWSSQIVDTVRGRGLAIVDRLASSCIVRTSRHGTTVRARFALR